MRSMAMKLWLGFAVLAVTRGVGAVAAAATNSKGCGEACKDLNDCPGQLICVDGKCGDDPQVRKHICSGSGSGGGKCKPSGYLPGKAGKCNREHDSECCEAGKKYVQNTCSPPVNADGGTAATMTINSFEEGRDGGAPSECDGCYHGDDELVVALSTGWYARGSRCLNKIRISANGASVEATVVDECDSVNGCDSDHDFQPPCPNNVVDASPVVWAALGISGSQVGDYPVTWSDA